MDNRAKIASVISIAWIIGTVVVVRMNWAKFNGMELNAVGDFLAGAFSPLAFLWLIVGYFQQGDELKQNTEALKLQAEELKHAVLEYKELNATNLRQVELAEKKHQEERAQLIKQNQLQCRFNGAVSTPRFDGFTEHKVTLKNTGSEVTQLSAKCSSGEIGMKSIYIHTLDRNQGFDLELEVPIDLEEKGYFEFSYIDGLGAPSKYLVFFQTKGKDIKIYYQPQEIDVHPGAAPTEPAKPKYQIFSGS